MRIMELDSSAIIRQENKKHLAYKYQENYALLLWKLQEKHGLSFEEATYFASGLYRAIDPVTENGGYFIENVFGLEWDDEVAWSRYLHDRFPDKMVKDMVEGGETFNPWESTVYQWFRGGAMRKYPDREKKVRYAIRLWLLQEIAGCTFLEARAYLCRERNETVASLAEAYSITEDDVLAAIASTERKAAEAEANGDLFHGYVPMYPDPDEKIDW